MRLRGGKVLLNLVDYGWDDSTISQDKTLIDTILKKGVEVLLENAGIIVNCIGYFDYNTTQDNGLFAYFLIKTTAEGTYVLRVDTINNKISGEIL